MEPSVKKILTKLSESKVELATENIELTAVGDASKVIAVTKQIIKRLNKDGDEYLKLHRAIQNDGDKLMSYFDSARRLQEKLEQGAKDLGMDPSPFVKMLDDLQNDMLRLRKKYTF